MRAEVAAVFRQREPETRGALLHQAMVRDLIGVAVVVIGEGPDLRLMRNSLRRRHKHPAARVSLVRPPWPGGLRRHGQKAGERKEQREEMETIAPCHENDRLFII
ncbi:hypothetical protein [Rhodoblastus sp.]|uniref:hypothetical protein n=1 Tax=Rhodoblastus sp. TaxID=1962975 RepID=UPI00260DEC5E|nr:hypothetical protein [Rhodoblastus sp.]